MKRPHQLPLYLPRQTSYSPADFIQNDCNRAALQWLRSWPEWTGRMCAIYGAHGCGKTHLAHVWQEMTRASFITRADMQNLTPQDAINAAQAFVLDDADTIVSAGREYEKWMFHFYNLVQAKGAWLLLCCLEAPTRWQIKLADLQSRLSTVISIAVTPPGEDALRTILYKLCSERGMVLTVEVADYILCRIERSFESARSLAESLDRHTLSTHRQPTLGLVRELLHIT